MLDVVFSDSAAGTMSVALGHKYKIGGATAVIVANDVGEKDRTITQAEIEKFQHEAEERERTIVFYKRQGKTDNSRIVGQRITTQHLASDSLKIWGRYGGKCSFYSPQSVCSVTRNSFYSEPPLSKMNPLTKNGVHLYHNSGHLPLKGRAQQHVDVERVLFCRKRFNPTPQNFICPS